MRSSSLSLINIRLEKQFSHIYFYERRCCRHPLPLLDVKPLAAPPAGSWQTLNVFLSPKWKLIKFKRDFRSRESQLFNLPPLFLSRCLCPWTHHVSVNSPWSRALRRTLFPSRLSFYRNVSFSPRRSHICRAAGPPCWRRSGAHPTVGGTTGIQNAASAPPAGLNLK